MSGDYYFDFEDTTEPWAIDGHVIGGHPDPASSDVEYLFERAAPCGTESVSEFIAPFETAGNYGVTWVFGGGSRPSCETTVALSSSVGRRATSM